MQGDVLILLLRLALLAALYVFLFQVFALLWRDLRPPAPAPSPQERSPAALEVLEAGATGHPAGELLYLEPVTSLGRTPQNTVVLGDSSVSAHHALVTYRMGQWWVEDSGSTNGTLVNNLPVTQATVISTGDVLRLGNVYLRARI